MKKRISLLTIITSLCFYTPTSQANEDEVCDGQVGAAYGLCTSYYNAIHCQQETDGQSKACEKIARNFMQITGSDINSLLCPCFDASDLDLLVQTCHERPLLIQCFDNTTDPERAAIGCVDVGDSYVATAEGANLCVLRGDRDGEPDTTIFDITPAEYASCLLLLRAEQESGSCDIGP